VMMMKSGEWNVEEEREGTHFIHNHFTELLDLLT
jgi:hypothetical protein